MSRNAAGTYTAPSNSFNPAVEGTPIEEVDWNSTLDDIEAALTDSLDRTGKGAVSAYVDFNEVAAPANPSANVIRVYAEDSGGGLTLLRARDSAGNLYTLGSGGVGSSIPPFDYVFDTGTADADPGSGKVRANNASLNLATQLFISETDRLGIAQQAAIATFDDSTTSTRGYLTLIDIANTANRVRYRISGTITDAGVYDKITVTYISGSTSLSPVNLALIFEQTGDAGAGTGDVVGPASATDNAVVRFDATTGKLVQNSSVTIADGGQIIAIAGSAGTPAYSFTGDPDTGFYSTGANVIDIATAGTRRAFINASGHIIVNGTNPNSRFYVEHSISGGSYCGHFKNTNASGDQCMFLESTSANAEFFVQDNTANNVFFGSNSGDAVIKASSGKSAKLVVAGVDRLTATTGVQIGAPTGGDKGAGTINAAADIYKNNSAYTNPDYVFEREYHGRVELFADREGAKSYAGRLSLDALRAHTRAHLRLPGITDEPMGMFERGDKVLEKLEELTLYVLDLHERIKILEARA